MKNLLVITVSFCFILVGLSSCNKGDTCDCGGGAVVDYSNDNLSNKELKLAKELCEDVMMCTWK